jgi:hypothetical protein
LNILGLCKRSFYVALLTLLVQVPLAHSALIGLQPDSNAVANGDSISLNLVISDLGNFGPDSLGAFDISVGFDSSVLSFTGYSLGSLLGDPGLFEALDLSTGESAGTVNVAEVSLLSALDLDALQPGEFTLATLNFGVNNLAVGATTQLSLLPGAVFADAAGAGLQVIEGSPAEIAGASPVPVPATPLLLLSALFGWRLLRRQHCSKK